MAFALVVHTLSLLQAGQVFEDCDFEGHTLLMHAARAGSAPVFRLVHRAMASVFRDSDDLDSKVSYILYVGHRALPRKCFLWRLPLCLPCVGITCLAYMGACRCSRVFCDRTSALPPLSQAGASPLVLPCLAFTPHMSSVAPV